ncbi:MAG: AI-2E family transporter [Clostridia bacterium]|nr:AI-2E family transporter [Clostridia bacterium]
MKIEWKSCFKVCVSIFLLYICILYWQPIAGFVFSLLGAAVPLLLGGAVAFLLNILMEKFEKIYFPKSQKKAVLKTRRPICILLAVVALLAIVVLVGWLVIPEFTDAVILLFEKLPDAINSAIDWIDARHLLPENVLTYLDNVNWDSIFDEMIGMIKNYGGDALNFIISTVSSLFTWIVNIFVALIFAVYILLNKEKLLSQSNRIMNRFISEKWCHKIRYVLRVLNDCFRRYTVGQSVEALILGVLCCIFMLIFGFPYATMISACIAFTALIPVAGAYIGGAVGFVMIMTESPAKAFLFVLFLVILQQLEGNLIYPRVVGSSMGLPGIWVLAAVVVGGGVAGILGMLLGVPLAAALYRMIRHDMRKHAVKQAEEATASSSVPLAEEQPADPPAEEEPAPKKEIKKEKLTSKRTPRGVLFCVLFTSQLR